MRSPAFECDHAQDAFAGQDGDTHPGLGGDLVHNRALLERLMRGVQEHRLSRLDDLGGEPAAEGQRLGVESLAVGDLVLEFDEHGLLVIGRHEHVERVEEMADTLADQFDDRLVVELLRKRGPDLIDDGQLRVSLPRLLDRPCTGQCGGDVLPNERQELQVSCREPAVLAVGLDSQHANSLALVLERDTQPLDRQDAHGLHLALGDHCVELLEGEPCRPASSQEKRCRPLALAIGEGVPGVRVREVCLDLVPQEGIVDQLSLVVV